MKTHRAQLVDFLKAQNAVDGKQLREIAGAASVAAVLEGSLNVPGLYVIRGSEKEDDAGHNVEVMTQFLLVTTVKNVRGPRGSDSSDEAEKQSNRARQWLDGFQPTLPQGDRFHWLKRVSGRTLRWTDQLLVWADIYELKHTRRAC